MEHLSYLRPVPYGQLLKTIASDQSTTVVLCAINYEECASYLCREVLRLRQERNTTSIRILPFRLFSRGTTRWSPLELIRDMFEKQLSDLAVQAGTSFTVKPLEYPCGPDSVVDLLVQAASYDSEPVRLVVDLSAIPRDLAVYLCDAILNPGEGLPANRFSGVFFVHTAPERVIGRSGVAPFSVGGMRCLYNPSLLRRSSGEMRNHALIFPGVEGFEAKAAVDALAEHDGIITVAIGCLEDGLPGTIELLAANQAVVSDATRDLVHLQFYFSIDDALRVALQAVDRAIKIVREEVARPHAFLVAPFGPRWAVLIGCAARREFIIRSRRVPEHAPVISDVLFLPSYQYVSVYSRGVGMPHAMEYVGWNAHEE